MNGIMLMLWDFCTLLARIHRPLRKHAQANMMRVALTQIVQPTA